MGNIFSELDSTEVSLRIIATKGYDDETGLVSISGWRGHLSEETPILFTVFDRNCQASWTRLVDQASTKRDTVKVKIPKSAVNHRIVANAELLRENHSCGTDVDGLRRFTVESSSICVAIATPEVCQLELFTGLSLIQSTNKTKKDSPAKLSLEIDRPSFDVARLRLTRSSRGVARWLITIEEVEASDRKELFLLPVLNDITDFDFQIEDGPEYLVEAIGMDRTGGNIFCRGSTKYKTFEEVEVTDWNFWANDFPLSIDKVTSEFKFPVEDWSKLPVETAISGRGSTKCKTGKSPVYTVDELCQLHQIAVSSAGKKSAPCVWLYRNKKPEYFQRILQQKDKGIMKPYPKDNSGDLRSPINGRIQGLFFLASVKPGSKTGEPIPDSAFGKQRILVPAGELVAKASNLYFTDFYCMNGKNHYVTLVMTRPGSNWDGFCAKRLLSLSISDRSTNPFFFYDCTSSQLHVSTQKQLIVELLFTENLDIRNYPMTMTPIGKNCRGSSKEGGTPKNPKCTKCNLQSPNQTSPISTA